MLYRVWAVQPNLDARFCSSRLHASLMIASIAGLAMAGHWQGGIALLTVASLVWQTSALLFVADSAS